VRTVAVIYAGDGGPPGRGLLAPLGGRPLVAHSVAAFTAAPQVDEVLLVATPEAAAGPDYGPGLRIVEACSSRAQSISRVMDTLGPAGPGCIVLVHDADRPLVSPRVIQDCLTALETSEAVCAAVPASDTMVAVAGDFITDRPPRARLRRRQYPQGFRLPVIRRAYELALADPGFRPADDCGVVLRYLPEVPVHLVAGSEQGFPVTSPFDLDIAGTLLSAGPP
jgi:2-C-methyl-D-erythritol 4-phosphate cytidylyltransferase